MSPNDSELVAATISKLLAETAKLHAETGKLNAENAKLARESRWYPAIVGTAFVTAVLALSRFF